jgi:hypothetical protein
MRPLAALGLVLAAIMPAGAQFGAFNGIGMGVQQQKVEPRRLEIRPWVRANANYWRNLTLLPDERNSNLYDDALGGVVGWGISGGKADTRSSIMAAYMGNIRYISRLDQDWASNNMLAFGYSRMLSREWNFSSSLYGGLGRGAIGLASGMGGMGMMGFNGFGIMAQFAQGGLSGFMDPATEGVVEDELFDTEVYFGGARAALTYSPNYRWQVGGGVLGSTAHRKSRGQFDLNAAGVFGQASYLIDPNTSVTGGYTYSRFTVPRVLRDSRLQAALLGISKNLTRRTAFSIGAGINDFSTSAVSTVALDPFIAEILGTSAILEIREVRRMFFSGGAMLRHVVTDRVSVAARYNRGLVPGNGIILPAARDNLGISAYYTGGTRWGLTLGAAGFRTSGIVQQDTTMLTGQLMSNVSYRMFRGFHATFGGGYRVIRLPSRDYRRQGFASVGFAWSPGELPLRTF